MNPIATWHDEHLYFNRLLASLRKQLDLFHAGERPNFELVLDVLSYLKDYGDDYHHPREDAAYELLGKRCPELRLTLARLGQDHRVIAQAGAALQKQVEAVMEDAVVPRADIEAALATYLVYYGNHIAREEEDVLLQAAKALTPEDWKAVQKAAPARSASGAQPEERYRQLRRLIALEA
jgi:hemerythrin-like domain-containing protein